MLDNFILPEEKIINYVFLENNLLRFIAIYIYHMFSYAKSIKNKKKSILKGI